MYLCRRSILPCFSPFCNMATAKKSTLYSERSPEPRNITINRDSVCAGDDVFDHRQTVELRDDATPKDLFKALKKRHFFPMIDGNNVVWVLTNRKHPFWIFSYFTRREKLFQTDPALPLSFLDDGSGLFFLKYYASPAKWKERILQEYGDDSYSRWRDGWDSEIKYCDQLTE